MDTIDQAIANFERLEFKNIRLYPYIPPINDKQEIEIIKTKLQKAREINSLHAFWLELELAEQIESWQEYLLATKTFQSLIEEEGIPPYYRRLI